MKTGFINRFSFALLGCLALSPLQAFADGNPFSGRTRAELINAQDAAFAESLRACGGGTIITFVAAETPVVSQDKAVILSPITKFWLTNSPAERLGYFLEAYSQVSKVFENFVTDPKSPCGLARAKLEQITEALKVYGALEDGDGKSANDREKELSPRTFASAQESEVKRNDAL